MSYTYAEALNAMEKIAQDLLKASYPNVQFYVRVVSDAVSGTASVDWSGDPRKDYYVKVTINMPVRKATYRMTSTEFAHWAAYLLHEVGHPNETDMVVWKHAVATNRHRLLNSLEDVREEWCTIQRGIANNALDVFSRLIDMLHAKNVAEGYDPNRPESIGWTLSTMGRYLNGYAIDVSDIKAKLDPNGIVGKIMDWALEELRACSSTQDCLDLSDRIVAAVREAKKAEEPKPEPKPDFPFDNADVAGGQPQPDQGGWTEDRGGDIPDEVDELDELDEAIDEEAAEEEAEEPQPQSNGSNQGGGSDQEPKEFSDADIEEQDLQPTEDGNLVSSGKNTGTHRYLNEILRSTITRPDSLANNPIVGRSVGGSVDMVTGNASKMGRQRALLARALKANELDAYDGNRAHGRLNTRALGRFAAGNMNVFGKRHVTEGYDTDVQILVDGSGSMSGNRILAASTLALVVSQAASQVGVDCTAHVFNDNGLHFSTKGKQKPLPKKFAYMINQIMGGTPLTENLLLAAQIQNHRAKGKRKIMFLITDGGCNLGPDVLKAAGEYVEQTMGTEIANLHIGGVCMGAFRNEVAVNVRKVEETGLKQLTAILERGL